MNKDVIYIDVEDDITAIIGKIKASKEKIIALVPPKRVGILQSAVNLRLLERMASNANKRLVLITNNQALIALSAAAAIPVAKNLQSKPELAEISALSIDDDEDIIDGAQLPVGELERTADVVTVTDKSIDKDIETLDIDDTPVRVGAAAAVTSAAKPSRAGKVKSGIKVPNFNTFRKKMFIGIAAGVVLIAFIVWAAIFAPAATVIITARTTPASVNTTVTLAGNAATDVTKGLIQSKVQTTKKDVSVEFDATGEKDIGAKATGTITVKNCDSNTSFALESGTIFTATSGQSYSSTSSATVPGFTGSASVCRNTGAGAGVVSIAVVADNSGEASNIAAASYTIDGVSGDVYANGSQMAGGTTKVVAVVTDADVQAASQKLTEQPSDTVKKSLIKLFTNGEVTIDDSFVIERAAPVSVPAVGAEATGKAKLTSSTTYTIAAIAKADLQVYLKADLEKQIATKTDQRVYDDGISKVRLSGYEKVGETSTVKTISTGQIGPQIDESQIKDQVKGKIYGEVQQTLEAIDGISSVDVQFSYFWVRTVPNNVDKITVEFKLENE
jgi:hypothetical protein